MLIELIISFISEVARGLLVEALSDRVRSAHAKRALRARRQRHLRAYLAARRGKLASHQLRTGQSRYPQA